MYNINFIGLLSHKDCETMQQKKTYEMEIGHNQVAKAILYASSC